MSDDNFVNIGYWKANVSETSNYPYPVANTGSKDDCELALALINVIERSATKIGYRGFSTCRICNQINGSQEYQAGDMNFRMAMPAGYRHYIEDHKVMPDLDNLELFIKLLK
jgi:hypothetical protein